VKRVPVIASEAKQSISPFGRTKAGLLRRFAPRNDGKSGAYLPSQRQLAILAVGEARFLQIEIAFDPPAVASMPWNRGGYSLKS
jgi:hypothetical protein